MALSGPPSSTASVMNNQDFRWAADVLIKLQRAIPRTPGDAIDTHLKFSSLVLCIASILPEKEEGEGLGATQQAVVSGAVAAILPIAIRALHNPLTHLTPAMIDLLRALARGSTERKKEFDYVPSGNFLPGRFRTHRYASFNTIKDYVDGLARAELFYEVNLEGTRRLRRLNDSPVFLEMLDNSLPMVTFSLNQWAVVMLFDGLRLRRGLEIAAPCGLLEPGQRAPYGLESTAAALLSDGETSMDRERVGRAAQFLIATSGLCNKKIACDTLQTSTHSNDPPDDPGHYLYNLQESIKFKLEKCRAETEQRCAFPGKSMRIILDEVVSAVNYAPFSTGTRYMLQYAFSYPCLIPCNLRVLPEYDGGLLSVWDACNLLMKTHAHYHAEILPLHSLLCAVLGGVVGNLLSYTITGPFRVHPESDVRRRIDELNESWPSGRKVVGLEDVAPRRGSACITRGKQVSATAAVCDAIERRTFKPEHCGTQTTDVRADGALTMHVITCGLAAGRGVFKGQPTDGIVSLKQLYFAALHAEPGIPLGRCVAYNLSDDWITSAFTDGVPAWPAGTIPIDSVEMAWREVMGGASFGAGPLFCFSRKAFEQSLISDWKPLPAVSNALKARGGERPKAVMLPARAMEMMAQRAQKLVVDTVKSIDNSVKASDGPPIVSRVVETLNAWSNSVYSSVNINPLWETAITHFCSPVPVKRPQMVGREPCWDRAAKRRRCRAA